MKKTIPFLILIVAFFFGACTPPQSSLIIVRDALPTDILPSGTTEGVTVAKWKKCAEGQVRVKKESFEMWLYDTTLRILITLKDFGLYRDGIRMHPTEFSIFDGQGRDISHLLSSGGDGFLNVESLGGENPANTIVSVVYTDFARLPPEGDGMGEEQLLDEQCNTYELKCTAINAHMGTPVTDADVISFQLLGDDYALPGSLVEGAENGVVDLLALGNATSANLLWSDYSAPIGTHDSSIPSSSSDWWTGAWIELSDYLWVISR